MGTNVLGDNIKAAIDALSEASKTDRTEVMRAIGNEVEDWHATYPPYEHDHDDRYYTEAEIAAILAGYAVAGHDHDLDYLGIGDKAANSELLDGIDSTGFSLVGHNHDATYLGISAKAADSDKLDNHDSSYFSVSTHNHSGVYEPAFSKNSAFNKNFAGTGVATTVGRSDHNHAATYLGISAKAADSEKVDNINGASLLRSDVDDIVSAHTEWQDNKQVRFGNDADFRMYHTGAIMYMRGYLHGAAFNIQGENASGVNKGLIYMDPDSYIRLHYAGSGKLETTSAGVAITGTLTVTTDTLVSNLNADKLDGQHSSYFSVSTHNHSGVYLPIAGKAADSSKLNNAVESVSAGNNTIVKRHASGYIFANYFNTTPNDVTSGITKICVESGNDGYIRHGTLAALQEFLGAGGGGGFDADTVDTLHANSFIRSDTDDIVTADILWQDNKHIEFGNSGDFKMLFNSAGNVFALWGAGDQQVIVASPGGYVRICYDGAAKIQTQATGASITGDLQVSANIPHKQTAKAWVNFNGIGTVTIRDSYNVSSITDNGSGLYTVNFTNAMSDTNYAVVITGRRGTTTNVIGFLRSGGAYSTTAVQIEFERATEVNVDVDIANVIIFGS